MASWFRRNDNAWIQTDRSERRKTVVTVLALLLLAILGVGLLLWAFLQPAH